MRPYEELRQQVRERLDSQLAERRRDALADRAARAGGSPPWRPLIGLMGLGLIRLGERLRGERWHPASRLARQECAGQV